MDKEMMKKYYDIKKDVESLYDNFSQMRDMAAHDAREYGSQALDTVKARVGDVSEMAKKKGKEVDRYAHDNPWHTAAALSLVGFVLGYVVSMKRQK